MAANANRDEATNGRAFERSPGTFRKHQNSGVTARQKGEVWIQKVFT